MAQGEPSTVYRVFRLDLGDRLGEAPFSLLRARSITGSADGLVRDSRRP
jgi:hypothetical protein